MVDFDSRQKFGAVLPTSPIFTIFLMSVWFRHCLPTGKKSILSRGKYTKRGSFEIFGIVCTFSQFDQKKKTKQCRRPEIRLGRANERVVPGLFAAILIGRTQIERWIRTTNGSSIKIWRT